MNKSAMDRNGVIVRPRNAEEQHKSFWMSQCYGAMGIAAGDCMKYIFFDAVEAEIFVAACRDENIEFVVYFNPMDI